MFPSVVMPQSQQALSLPTPNPSTFNAKSVSAASELPQSAQTARSRFTQQGSFVAHSCTGEPFRSSNTARKLNQVDSTLSYTGWPTPAIQRVHQANALSGSLAHQMLAINEELSKDPSGHRPLGPSNLLGGVGGDWVSLPTPPPTRDTFRNLPASSKIGNLGNLTLPPTGLLTSQGGATKTTSNRQKPPLVVQLEAFIRRELRLLPHKKLQGLNQATVTETLGCEEYRDRLEQVPDSVETPTTKLDRCAVLQGLADTCDEYHLPYPPGLQADLDKRQTVSSKAREEIQKHATQGEQPLMSMVPFEAKQLTCLPPRAPSGPAAKRPSQLQTLPSRQSATPEKGKFSRQGSSGQISIHAHESLSETPRVGSEVGQLPCNFPNSKCQGDESRPTTFQKSTAPTATSRGTGVVVTYPHTGAPYQDMGSPERLYIFGEAFTTLAHHFSEYTDLFLTIKSEFDAGIMRGASAQRRTLALERELATAKSYVQYIVEHETQVAKSQAKTLKMDLQTANDKIAALQRNLEDKISENMRLQDKIERKDLENKDHHGRCKLLSDALTSENERQASVVDELHRVKKDQTKLETYSLALEEQNRTDAIIIEEKDQQIALLEQKLMHFTLQNDQLREGGSPTALTPSAVSAITSKVNAAKPKVPDESKKNTTKSSMPTSPKKSVKKLQEAAQSLVKSSGAKIADMAMILGGSFVDKPGLGAGGDSFKDAPKRTISFKPIVPDGTVDELEDVLTKTAGREQFYHRKAFQLQKICKEQAERLSAFVAHRGDRRMEPRPHWEKLVQRLPTFNPNPEATSDELLNDLCEVLDEVLSAEYREMERKALGDTVLEWLGVENICEGDLHHFKKTFVGLGCGSEIPRYLRWHGRVRNRKMSKGSVEHLLKLFWRERQRRRRMEGTELMPIQDFYWQWLMQQTSNSKLAVELAYNMIDICQQFPTDPDCYMFVHILDGDYPEESLVDQIESVQLLQRMLERQEKSDTMAGWIRRSQMIKTLRKLFPAKPREHMLKLKFAFLTATTGDDVHFVELFEEDANGNQHRFVEYIRKQHLDESIEFSVDIREAIRKKIGLDNRICMADVIAALKKLDPGITESDIQRVLVSGCRIKDTSTYAAVSENHVHDGAEFLQNLRGIFIKRRTAAPKLPSSKALQSRGTTGYGAEDYQEPTDSRNSPRVDGEKVVVEESDEVSSVDSDSTVFDDLLSSHEEESEPDAPGENASELHSPTNPNLLSGDALV